MLTENFKPKDDETDKNFRERVQRFADAVSTLAVKFLDNGPEGTATKAEVLYFP